MRRPCLALKPFLSTRLLARYLRATQARANAPAPPLSERLPMRRGPITTKTVRESVQKGGQPLVMLTAYDFPSSLHAERAGVDIVLVGDSLGMVVLGHRTTQPVRLEDMIHHCAAARRGVTEALLVADLPFGSYETSPEDAMRAAYRLVKEAGADAVKLEGGSQSRCAAIRAVVDGGVAVMGHVGLTPQSVSIDGSFRAVGRSARTASVVLDQALAVQDAGAFAVVLECVPAPVARAITDCLHVPTIGIGAGPHCKGQVLVYHDLLGLMANEHHTNVAPKFSKQYAEIGAQIDSAIQTYCDDVRTETFPSSRHAPYQIPELELERFTRYVNQLRAEIGAKPEHSAGKAESGDDASIKIY